MKFLKIFAIIILVLAVIFLAVAAFLPDEVATQGSVMIKAKAEVPFRQVNSFKNWPNWSPWSEKDPAMVSTYSGPEQGKDAMSAWESEKLGDGSQIIEISEPYTAIHTKTMVGGGVVKGHWSFKEAEGGTEVIWISEAKDLSYPIGRYFGLIFKPMMQPMMDKGLANLKAYSEEQRTPLNVKVTEVAPFKALLIKDSSLMEPENMEAKMDELYGELMAHIMARKIPMAGSPFSVYHGMSGDMVIFSAGIPIAQNEKGRKRIEFAELAGGKACMASYFGPYEGLEKAYADIEQYKADFGYEAAGDPWEVYITDPMGEPDPSKWQTDIYFPIK